MPDRSLWLDFFGSGIQVSATTDTWIDGIIRAFPDFVSENPVSDPVSSLRIIETDRLPAVPALPLTWEGVLPEGFDARIFESEDEAYFTVEERVAIMLSYRTGEAEAFVLSGSHDEFFTSAVISVVDSALARDGQYLVHGACLVEKNTDRAILICAPSGAGKTTTAMALARDGFSLVTDDASFVVPTRDAPRSWGLPRTLKVHRKTAELLPWIGPLPDRWDSNGEQGVPLAQIDERLSITKPAPRELAAILLLGPRSENDHSLRRLSKAELLIALAHDNVAGRPAGMTIKAQTRFEVLADTIARVPAFVLSAGKELETLPKIVADGLERHIAEMSVP